MTNILALTSIFIKNGIISSSSNSKKTKKDKSKLIFAFVFLLYFLLFFIPIIFVVKDIVKDVGFEDVFLSMILPFGAFTSIALGVFSITSVFYFNKDSAQLLPLPIKSGELLIAKFIAALIPQYLILMMFIFPSIFGIGIGMQAGLLYYLYALIICILIPIIPSILTAIVIMLLNKLFHFNKRKDLFMYIMTGIILIFSLGYGFIMGNAMEMDSELVNSFLTGNKEYILQITKWIFPFFNPAVTSLVNYNEFIGLAGFITFIGLNILGFVILYFLSNKLYIKGLKMDKGNSKNKDDKLKEKYKVSKSGIGTLLLKNEWINICRTPVYMLNIVLVNIVFMLPVLIMIFTTPKEIIEVIDYKNSSIYFFILAGLIMFSNMGGSMASASAFSRDGKSAIYRKSLPIGFKKAIDMKVLLASIIDIVFILIMEIPAFIYFKMPFYYFFILNIPIIFLIGVLNYVGVLLDLYKPNLTWSDDNEPLKQNLSTFINFMLTILVAGVLALIGYLLLKTTFNVFLSFLLFTIIVIVCYILLVLYVKKNQVKLFNKVG